MKADILIFTPEPEAFPLTNRVRELRTALENHAGLVKIMVSIDKAGEGWSVRAACLCTSAESALAAVQLVLDTMSAKFRTLIRVHPKAESDFDFATQTLKHGGLTRFIVIPRPGGHEDIQEADPYIGFGHSASEAA